MDKICFTCGKNMSEKQIKKMVQFQLDLETDESVDYDGYRKDGEGHDSLFVGDLSLKLFGDDSKKDMPIFCRKCILYELETEKIDIKQIKENQRYSHYFAKKNSKKT